jgi:predicted dehydrogenase
VEIVGDKGALRLAGGSVSFKRFEPAVPEFNRTNTQVWGSPAARPVDLGVEPCESGHQVILRNFARAILYAEPLVSPGEVGLGSLELANAIILSSHRKKPVEVPIDRREYNRLISRLRGKSKFRDQWTVGTRETDPRLKK